MPRGFGDVGFHEAARNVPRFVNVDNYCSMNDSNKQLCWIGVEMTTVTRPDLTAGSIGA
jgi:hypothetical protein